MKQRSGFAVLIAVLCATSVYAHGYGGMQGGSGGGGGGGFSNPATADLDMGGFSVTNVNNVYASALQDVGDIYVGGGAEGTLDVRVNESTIHTTGANGLALASGKTITGGTLSWTSWTPTGSWSTNVTYTGTRARIGNDLLARVKVAFTGAPAGAGALTVNLPSGLTIDTTAHCSPAISAAAFGVGQALDAGTAAHPLTVSYHTSDTLVVVNAINTGGSYGVCSNVSDASNVPFTWASGDSLTVEFRVTCTGW